jgi:hypothetical protein
LTGKCCNLARRLGERIVHIGSEYPELGRAIHRPTVTQNRTKIFRVVIIPEIDCVLFRGTDRKPEIAPA